MKALIHLKSGSMTPLTQSTNTRDVLGIANYVLGIDIGGQSIKPALYTVLNGKIAEDEDWKPAKDPATHLGFAEHIKQITDIIAKANAEAQKLGGQLVAVGIGSPGRFRADGTIKPGTNDNLSKMRDEFDEKNLLKEYAKALADRFPELAGLPLTVDNDGKAMLTGMVVDIVHGPHEPLHDQHGNEIGTSTLRNKRVAVMGIGTGVGHAIADVTGKGQLDFITDGHACKLCVPVDEADWPMVEKAAKRLNTAEKPEVIAFPDHTVRAEDLFRDPVLKALAGVNNAKDIDWETNQAHAKVVQFAGKYMGRLLAMINSGQSTDVDPKNGWDDTDKAEAAKTEYYLIGGGVGDKPLGAEMIRYAQVELQRQDVRAVKMVQYTRENPAPRAAAMTVPSDILTAGG